MKILYLVALVLALVGTVLAAIAYLAPFGNTGVDGSIGALLALVGAFSSAAGLTIVLATGVRGGLLKTLYGLIILAAVLTAVAAYFLMQFALMLAMIATVMALVIAIALRPNRRIAP